jgi:alanyl aminopeptidase
MPAAVVAIMPVETLDPFDVVDCVPVVGLLVEVVGEPDVEVVAPPAPPEPSSSPQPIKSAEAPMDVTKKEKRIARFMRFPLAPLDARVTMRPEQRKILTEAACACASVVASRPMPRPSLAPLVLAVTALACTDPSRTPAVPSRPTSEATPLRWEAPPPTSVHLPTAVVPTKYKLELTVDPAKDRFSGRTTIAVRVNEATDHVVLHGRDLTVKTATVTAAGKRHTAQVRLRRSHGAKDADEELVLLLGDWLRPGDAEIQIEYDAPFGSLWGLFKVTEGGKSFAFTQLESTFARRMFPSFDEPRHKTPFDVVLEVPATASGYANTQLAAEDAGTKGYKRLTFETSKPMPTYLVAIAVGELERADGPKEPAPIRVVAGPGRAKLGTEGMEAARRSLASLESYFGIPYPYGKLDLAAVPNFAVGAMENAGLVTFREELLLTGPTSPAMLRRRMALVMAHELAHQWFGNLVTMRWWDDIWLNEGFATWMQAKVCDDAFDAFGAQAERVLSKDVAMRFDVLPSARAVRPKVELADDIGQVGGWSAYQKGASILAMLETWTGEEAFRNGIRSYVAAQADKSITSTELFAALDTTTQKPVSKVARTFLDQSGVPLVSLSLTCDEKKKGPVKATLEASAIGGPKEASWSVPVCLRVAGEAAPRCVLLDGGRASVDLDRCPAWVHPNAGEAGYYRYDLDEGSWTKLASSFAKLEEAERAGLLLDAWALVLAGRRGAEQLLGLLQGVDWKEEKSRVVIEAAIAVLTEMDRTLVDASTREPFGKLVRRVLEPTKKRLGMPGATEAPALALLRVSTLAALHDLARDPEVAKALEQAARRYVEDPTKAAALVGPDLGPLAARVAVASLQDGATLLDEKHLLAAKSPDHRVGLTVAIASRAPASLRPALDLLRSGSIRAGDFRHVKSAVAGRPESRAVFYAFATEHFDELAQKLGGASTLAHTVGWACGDEPAALAFAKEVEKRLPNLEGARRGFEEGTDERKRCGAVRAQEHEAFARKLKK